MNLHLAQNQRTTLEQRMQMGMTLSGYIELSGADLSHVVEEIEGSVIFQKLSSPGEERVIEVMPVKRYFPAFTVRPEQKEASLHCPTEVQEIPALTMDIESLIERHITSRDERLFSAIKNMGSDRFHYYFIEGEGTDVELSHLLDTSVTEIRTLLDVFDRALLADTMGMESASRSFDSDFQRTEIIAEVSFVNDEPQISFTHDRIRYRIDEEKFMKLAKRGRISPEEVKEFKNIRDRLTMINYRFNLLQEIVKKAVDTQKAYLLSFELRDTHVLEERDVAFNLKVDPSWICRLIQGTSSRRYVKSGNRIISLRDLFISGKQLKKRRGMALIQTIYDDPGYRGREKSGRFTDEDIQKILHECFDFTIGRRTINNWRREMR